MLKVGSNLRCVMAAAREAARPPARAAVGRRRRADSEQMRRRAPDAGVFTRSPLSFCGAAPVSRPQSSGERRRDEKRLQPSNELSDSRPPFDPFLFTSEL